MMHPFDAVLLISFGGPQSVEDIRPFLRNVLRNRRIPERRFEAVVEHYTQFGGRSPVTPITLKQAEGLRRRLADDPQPLPVYVGMRNWHPFLEDTLSEMSRDGVRRAIAVPMAAQHCYSSCGQYKQNVVTARQQLPRVGLDDVELIYVSGWHDHPKFVATHASHAAAALNTLPADMQTGARLVFTAHSIPESMATGSRYVGELVESASQIAAAVQRDDWTLVYQSRSGRPDDPWLEPDVCDYLRAEHARGLRAVVLSPIGFVADHIEVLYDLDHEAGELCRDLGIAMARAASVNDDSLFLDMLADIVRDTRDRYAAGRPLPVVPAVAPARTEPPPPER